MKVKVYTYVKLITKPEDEDCGKWKGVSMSESGNCYRCRAYETEADARLDVFQNVKGELNEISDRFVNPSWYDIIESYEDSPEMEKAIACYERTSRPLPLWKRIRLKILIQYFRYRDYMKQWVYYFRGLFSNED